MFMTTIHLTEQLQFEHILKNSWDINSLILEGAQKLSCKPAIQTFLHILLPFHSPLKAWEMLYNKSKDKKFQNGVM